MKKFTQNLMMLMTGIVFLFQKNVFYLFYIKYTGALSLSESLNINHTYLIGIVFDFDMALGIISFLVVTVIACFIIKG